MSKILELINKKRIYFDGGAGTYLQAKGLKPGTPPEMWNMENPEAITGMHKAYIDAGCNVITTNTFGVNKDKYANYEELIVAAVNCAKKATEGAENSFIAFDIGPTGRLLKPLGDLEFEDAVELFAANVRVAVKCGVDCVIVETMNDSLETKAAVLAVKENSDLPVFVTNVYDEGGKLMTGASPEAMIALLEGLGVDGLGLNCSVGPDKMLAIIDRFVENASVPIIANPNAGLPVVVDGKTAFNIDAEEFSEYMVKLAQKGVNILGGCCGTTPEYMKKTVEKTAEIEYKLPEFKNNTVVSSYTQAVQIGKKPILIGERINPTGKKKLKEALKTEDLNYILNEGITQAEKGVHILDVNVGLPEIDEAKMMKKVVTELQAVTDLPLQIDTSDPSVLEGAMRCYNGKPLVNSVNGEADSMEAVFPLVKKYGGTVIALAMDKSGIPETAEGRVAVAMRIIEKAKEYGIDKKDIVVDPLALTISSEPTGAIVTLKAVKMLKDMGIKTSLGVSNISFGLPKRDIINSTFFANAMENGLDCAIMNPFSEGMMNAYYAYNALHNLDTACTEYIGYADSIEEVKTVATSDVSLKGSIVKGMSDMASKEAQKLLETEKPLDVINSHIIPALNEIGKAFEEKKAYLPQLLMSAEAATAAFDEVKKVLPSSQSEGSGKVILATVKGDIHDIGKNIVKVLLESYGFSVIDLGRDVDPQDVCKAAVKNNCKLVGLSALMTTTVPSMEETIRQLHALDKDITVAVGGAVLNDEYAKMIKADFYGPDAMDMVRFTEEFYK
ncbi:MAG: homocysteine S-methyltransferase family protein [Clostridia bacterium]|nr:homocysteine S-methyltransferase family protein [Clostridia bacterium]